MEIIRGKVWVFGDDVDTDLIVPGEYLDLPLEQVVSHVLESVKPNFAAEVKRGDIIVAGKNFGCGSRREHAPSALKQAGIGCVVAESFGRIFFRNAIAIGLPVLTCKGARKIFEEGHRGQVLIKEFKLENLTTSVHLQREPLSEEVQQILDRGGILEYLKEVIN